MFILFLAVPGLHFCVSFSPVEASVGGSSLAVAHGSSLQGLLLWSTGCRARGLP